MKRPYIIISVLAASLCLWQCSFEEAQPLSLAAPEINFITQDEVISAKVGEQVIIKTETVAGDRLTRNWYVDGVLTCASDNFTYTFETPGTYTVKYVVFNGTGTVEKSYTVKVSDVLEIHLSSLDSAVISRKELTSLQLYAIVDRGSDVTHSWTVDGEKVCDGVYFTYYLPNANVTHTVVYEGKNSVDEFTRTIEVNVEEQVLEVEFSDKSRMQPYYEYNDDGSELRFSMDAAYYIMLEANVLHGGTGAVHQWSVDGVQVSDAAKLIRPLQKMGTYTVDYICTNARGETVERSWDIVYDGSVDGFADGNLAELFQLHNANANYLAKESLSVIESPYDGDGHGKVLKWYNNSNNKTRGGILLRNEYFAENGIDISQFKGIRFSGRLDGGEGSTMSETARRSPCVAYQTDYSTEYKSVSTIKLGTGDAGFSEYTPWNYVSKPYWSCLKYSVDFSKDGILKIYPTCTVNKTTVVSGYFAIVYIDDIVLYR